MKRMVLTRVLLGLTVALTAAAAQAQCGGGGGGVVRSKPAEKGLVLQIVSCQGELSYSFCPDATAARARKGEIAQAYAQALETWRQARSAFAKDQPGLLFPEVMPVEPAIKTIAQKLAAEAEGKKKIDAVDNSAWAVVLIESAGGAEHKAVPQLALPYYRELARAKHAASYNAWVAAGADKAKEPAKPRVKELAAKLSRTAAETKAAATSQKAAVTATADSTASRSE